MVRTMATIAVMIDHHGSIQAVVNGYNAPAELQSYLDAKALIMTAQINSTPGHFGLDQNIQELAEKAAECLMNLEEDSHETDNTCEKNTSDSDRWLEKNRDKIKCSSNE